MKYTSVKVPKRLSERIQSICEEWGYRSITEFVIESARLRLLEKENER